jgi:hypothetical protein
MLFIPASFGVGRLVARLHRTRTPAMVLTFLVVTWFLNIPDFWRVPLGIDYCSGLAAFRR